MTLLDRLQQWLRASHGPEHLRRGRTGELAAKHHLQAHGLRFLAANFRSGRAEIDLVFLDTDPALPAPPFHPAHSDCVVFVEVKTRSVGSWLRPAAAVHRRKRTLLSRAALRYLHSIGNPRVRVRFDIVEVLMREGQVHEIRHLPNAFPLEGGLNYIV